MKTVTREEMLALDRRATAEFGIPSLLLMENAGRGVAEVVAGFGDGSFKKMVIFAGKGNNGGDGFVAARHLHNRGFLVDVFLIADPQHLQGDAALNYEILLKMKVPFISHFEDLHQKEMIVDALFGIGLRAPVEGLHAAAVQAINQSGLPVVAVDIPSGLDSNAGQVQGVAVKASVTAALGAVKQGLLCGQGPAYSGKICVVDIGLPKDLL